MATSSICLNLRHVINELLSLKTYQLNIRLQQDANIVIGKLGTFRFPAGRYIYTGSAKKNMEARIQRHLSQSKNNKWHIDFLLSNPDVKVTRVSRYEEEECIVNQHTKGKILVSGFGATDCRHGCGSHLKFKGKR